MNKIKNLLCILYSFKNHENRKKFMVKLREYLEGITKQPELISSPYDTNRLQLGVHYKILLVVHQFSRTGAPNAVLYLARALFSICGIRPVVISPVDGPLREEFEREGFSTIVDPQLFSYQSYSSDAYDFVASFERVIVTSLASFNFIRGFRGIAKCQTWWIHETDAGFDAVASMTNDLPLLFAVCESIWLGSPLCFPFALKYAPQDKLNLLLYGCADTAFLSEPNKLGKTIFSIIGTVDPRKGQDIFLKAIQLLPATLRGKAIFRIIGSPLSFGVSEVFYKEICASAKSISEVELISNMPQEELQKYYAETDVIVSASRDDPMPIVVTQGLMFSKVCVCSSVIGHAQLIENGKDGLIFTNESAEELAEKMRWILQSPAQINSLGVAGRAIYEKHFDMTSFVDNVRKLSLHIDK